MDDIGDDDRFFSQLSELLGTPEMGEGEREAVLDLTRLVAHSSQRRYAPLTAYALGLSISGQHHSGDRMASVRQAIAQLQATMADE